MRKHIFILLSILGSGMKYVCMYVFIDAAQHI